MTLIKKLYFRFFSKLKRKFYFLVIALILFEYIANLIFTKYILDYFNPKPIKMKYVVNTKNCKIRDVDFVYDAVKPYLNWNADYSCDDKIPLVIQNDTHLMIFETAFPYYGIRERRDVECAYYYFWRKEPKDLWDVDHEVIYGDFQAFVSGAAKITNEFVRVNCTYQIKNTTIILKNGKLTDTYVDYFAFVIVNETDKPENRENNEKYNVLILGLDSASRLNFHRQMPKTAEYLTKKLNAVEFFGYTKLGSNTFPNLIPVFTGQSVEEIRESCWPTDISRFDNCSFIWSDFHKAGYVTSYAEDLNVFGLFHYLKYGFIKQPVDHMWGVFEYQASKEIGGHHRSLPMCIGCRLNYLNLLAYTYTFIKKYNSIGIKYFGTFWESSWTHGDINYGRYFDKDYADFFKSLYLRGYLNNTIVFLMGDHGFNTGILTIEGLLESRLPIFYTIVPPDFVEKHPKAYKNLIENSRKLTSHWDLHATLKAIVEDDFSDNFVPNRNISIFKPIPSDRSCESAGIVPHWCTCSYLTTVSAYLTSVQFAADIAVKHINKILENHPECIELVLDKTLVAYASRDITNEIKLIEETYITVIFRTKVSLATFEATVVCYACVDLEDFKLAGPVSRKNVYGNDSACVNKHDLLPYCYCKGLIKKQSVLHLIFKILDYLRKIITYLYTYTLN